MVTTVSIINALIVQNCIQNRFKFNAPRAFEVECIARGDCMQY